MSVRAIGLRSGSGTTAKPPALLPGRGELRHAPQGTVAGGVEIDHLSDGTRDTLTIAVWETGTTTELAVRGEWDLAAQATARKAVRTALELGPECVVLNLSHCSFIDSSGMHAVLGLHNRCAQENIHLVIIPGPRAVQRPFEICKLTRRLPFVTAA